jgi:hypothetical protein
VEFWLHEFTSHHELILMATSAQTTTGHQGRRCCSSSTSVAFWRRFLQLYAQDRAGPNCNSHDFTTVSDRSPSTSSSTSALNKEQRKLLQQSFQGFFFFRP